MSLLVREIAARIQGDDNAAKAAKIARKCVSSVKSQIAALEAREVDLEDSLETALENLNNAQYPTEAISSGQSYIRGIESAQQAFNDAEEELASVKDSIAYFVELQKRHNGNGKKS